MNGRNHRSANKWLAWLVVLAIWSVSLTVFAQTKIVYHKNKYKLTDDVTFGRRGAADVERQFPLLRDKEVDAYVEKIGQRLVASIPREFQHDEFRYSFNVFNARDVNAFALPGGPMYVDRGMIEAAHNEGELAGIMAHEVSHVALRHGTAKATNDFSLGFLGPRRGFSRQYETEADLLGARIMATAGYDPLDLANMFRTIERQGGAGGGFLRTHPSPANRYERINQEAQYLQVHNPIRDSSEFLAIKERLHSYTRAQSMAEIQQSSSLARPGKPYPTRDQTNYPAPPRGRVDNPSTRFRAYTELAMIRVSVPDNWRETSEQGSVWFAPNGGYRGAVGG